MTAHANDENDSGRQPGDGAEAQRRPLHERSIELTDPRAMRAYAHPVRMALIGLLRTQGPLTATQAAEQLGESSGTCSFHLRQLAKYGFVEQVQGADARERPWRVVHTSYSAEGIEEQAGGPAAMAVLEQVTAERAVEDLIEWHERRGEWSEGWRSHTGVGRSTLYLTEQEAIQLTDAMDALLGEFAEQRPLDDIASRPEGSVPVEFTLIVVPRKSTTEGH